MAGRTAGWGTAFSTFTMLGVALAQVRGFFFWVPCLPHGYRNDRQTILNLSEHVWQAGVLILNISLP